MTDKKQTPEEPKQQFGIQQIYVKDLSYEATCPMHELKKEWKPELSYKLDVKNRHVEDNYYEVTLISNAVVTLEKDTVFIVELQHCGLFYMLGFSDDQKDQLFNAICPNILYPYSREVISECVTKGGFPALHISPIDFDMRYRDIKAQRESAN